MRTRVTVSTLRGPFDMEEVERLERDARLAGYRYLPAIKADLLNRLDRPAEAALAYREVLERPGNEAETEFLARRLAELDIVTVTSL